MTWEDQLTRSERDYFTEIDVRDEEGSSRIERNREREAAEGKGETRACGNALRAIQGGDSGRHAARPFVTNTRSHTCCFHTPHCCESSSLSLSNACTDPFPARSCAPSPPRPSHCLQTPLRPSLPPPSSSESRLEDTRKSDAAPSSAPAADPEETRRSPPAPESDPSSSNLSISARNIVHSQWRRTGCVV